jgi:hypothetical protein
MYVLYVYGNWIAYFKMCKKLEITTYLQCQNVHPEKVDISIKSIFNNVNDNINIYVTATNIDIRKGR